MLVREANHCWVTRAPAKLNLFLEVLGRRDDGYHELETLMVPAELGDELSFQSVAEGDVELECLYPVDAATVRDEIPPGEDNLVVRAVQLVRDRFGVTSGARLRLLKRIPAAAGLGGGSSDAAAALRLANVGWNLGLSADDLAPLAERLGSDVPFFLKPGPAVCRGRGELVEKIDGLGRLQVVVAKPREGLSTARVFDAWRPGSRPVQSSRPLIDALRRGDLFSVGRLLFNRLEATAMGLVPSLRTLAEKLSRIGISNCHMSGSGTSLYGLCQHARQARRAAAWLRGQGEWALATSSRR